VPSAAAQQAPETPAAVDDTATNGDAKNPAKRPSTGNGSGVKNPSSTTNAEPDKPKSGGLAGLQGLNPNGPKGPDTGGPSGTVSGGGQLDSTQLSSTVARYKGSVQRACWQPALDTRDKDAPTTARVNVAIVILPSGSVQSATVGADPKGYRGLSQCISNRVRGWQFPPSGENTTVNVPFVFASQ
jgi:outer membrane biosynthesis protein TonB